MQKNMMPPFKIGKPVEDEYFINRDSEIKEILQNITAKNNISLLGLRRTGKTSTLLRIINMLETQKHNKKVPVYINCYGIPEMRRFSELFVDSVRNSYIKQTGDKKFLEKIKHHIKEKIETLAYHLTDMDVEIAQYFKIKIGVKQKEIDEHQLFVDALSYPENLSVKKACEFVIILDEFQDIGIRWGEDIIKKMRSVVETQKHCMFIFSGSSITFMADLVDKRKSPFYRQMHKIYIKPLPREITENFVKKRLKTCRYKISEDAVKRFIELTRCFPDYIQRLGQKAAYYSKNIGVKEIDIAYEDMLLELDSEFRELINKLNQRAQIYGEILIAMSNTARLSEIGDFIGGEMMQKYMQRIYYLQRVGLIERAGKGLYQITDPVLNDWLKRNFTPTWVRLEIKK